MSEDIIKLRDIYHFGDVNIKIAKMWQQVQGGRCELYEARNIGNHKKNSAKFHSVYKFSSKMIIELMNSIHQAKILR